MILEISATAGSGKLDKGEKRGGSRAGESAADKYFQFLY